MKKVKSSSKQHYTISFDYFPFRLITTLPQYLIIFVIITDGERAYEAIIVGENDEESLGFDKPTTFLLMGHVTDLPETAIGNPTSVNGSCSYYDYRALLVTCTRSKLI